MTLPLCERSVFDHLVADTSPEAASAILAATLPDVERLGQQVVQFSGSETDINALRSQAHLCKSAAGYTGALRLQALCQVLEGACDQGDIDTLRRHLDSAPSVISDSINHLQSLLSA